MIMHIWLYISVIYYLAQFDHLTAAEHDWNMTDLIEQFWLRKTNTNNLNELIQKSKWSIYALLI